VAAGADRVARVVGRLPAGGRRVPTLAGVLAIALAFLHHLPLHRQDRTPVTRPDNLAAVSALAARQLRSGEPVLFLPAIGRRAALAYPGEFREAWDIALRESGARSGTLYGREAEPEVLRRRLGGLDRVWVVAEPYAGPGSRWYPSDPTERVKVTVVAEEFVPGEPRQETMLQGGVTLRLYVRRVPVAATGSPASPPAPPNPAST
jgi:mannosyltransferase